MSGMEPEVWMVQWTYDGEVWVDAHADEPRARDQARDRGGECLPMVREVAAQAEIARLRSAITAILNAETVTVHVGYDDGAGGGNYVYAEAVRTDSDAFVEARAALSRSKE